MYYLVIEFTRQGKRVAEMYELNHNDPVPILTMFMIEYYNYVDEDDIEALEEIMNKHHIDHYYIEPEFGSLLTKIKWPKSNYLDSYKQAVYRAFKDASQLSKE